MDETIDLVNETNDLMDEIIEKSTNARIVSDLPVMEDLKFGFDSYAKTLANIIANKENETPLSIGIYGPWGSGKTTLMSAIKRELKEMREPGKNNKDYRHCRIVWFEPWKYSNRDETLASLIEAIMREMEKDGKENKFDRKVRKMARRFNKKKAVGLVSRRIMGQDITELFDDLPHVEKLGYQPAFQEAFKDLLKDYPGEEGVTVVFIEDLDRCPIDQIVRVLETMNFFITYEGCVFVIGADKKMISDALKNKGIENPNRFMEKIVHISFDVPKLKEKHSVEFMESLINDQLTALPEWGHSAIHNHSTTIASALNNNPRRLKRFLNSFNITLALAAQLNRSYFKYMDEKEDAEFIDILVRWLILEFEFPEITAEIRGNDRAINKMKNSIKKVEKFLGDSKKQWDVDIKVFNAAKVDEKTRKCISDRRAVEVLRDFPENMESIEIVQSLSQTVDEIDFTTS